jgi:hypothetical protein
MPPARFGIRETLLLFVVLGVAGAARAGYLLTCANDPRQPPPLAVQDAETAINLHRSADEPATDRDLLVDNLREGHGFATRAPLADLEEPTGHLAPAYCWLIGTLAGWQNDADATTWTVRWAQAILGTMTVGLYFLFARLAFGSVLVGCLAGMLTAIHPYWIINIAELQDGVLASFVLALCLFLGTAASRECRPAASLLFGLALAGLALTRAALLPYAFLACLWLLVRCRTLPRGWLCALLAFLGFANGLTPWLVRNYLVFGDLVPVTNSAYVHLWVGNNRLADGGPQDEKTLRAALPSERLTELLGEANQARRYGKLGHTVAASVQNDPARSVENRLRSLLAFIFGEDWIREPRRGLARTSSSAQLPPTIADYWPLALRVDLLVMLGLGLYGWRWSYGWKREANLASLAVLWIPLPYLLGHAEHFQGPRLPLDGVLLCFMAFALAWIFPPVARIVFPSEDADNE